MKYNLYRQHPQPPPERITGSAQYPPQARVPVLVTVPQPLQPWTTAPTPNQEIVQAMPVTREMDPEKIAVPGNSAA